MKNLFIIFLFFISIKTNAQIIGADSVCAGGIYIYSVNMPGAVTFNWTVPTGWYNLQGQGSDSITVRCNVNDDSICVTGYDSSMNVIGIFCKSLAWASGGGGQGWDVQPNQIYICEQYMSGAPMTFTLHIVPNGTGGSGGVGGNCNTSMGNGNIVMGVYSGTWPGGSFVGIADSTTQIPLPSSAISFHVYEVDTVLGKQPGLAQVISGGSGGGGTINNSVGTWSVPVNSFTITQSYPPWPTCVGETVSFVTTGILNCMSWMLQGPYPHCCGSGISLGFNLTPATDGSYGISAYRNSPPCFVGDPGCFQQGYINLYIPPCYNTIYGDTTVCTGHTYTYTADIFNALTYNWTFPSGWYNIQGQGTAIVTATSNQNGGQICVTASCQGGAVRSACITTQLTGSDSINHFKLTPENFYFCQGDSGSVNVAINNNLGSGCPYGCDSGTTAPNLAYVLYDAPWPNGNLISWLDSMGVSISYPNTDSIYYAYLIDTTAGTSTSTAKRITGGCNAQLNADTLRLHEIIATSFQTVYYDANPICYGDTVHAWTSLPAPWVHQWFIDSVFYSYDESITIMDLSVGAHAIMVIATLNNCTRVINSDIIVYPKPYINLGNDISGCNQLIDAGAGYGSYLWSTGETTQSIYLFTSSAYSVIITDSIGCANSDMVNAILNVLPFIDLGNDTSGGCPPMMLNAPAGYTSYLWSTGETTQTTNATITGNYWVIITDTAGCANADTINVTLDSLPLVNLGNDKVNCGPAMVLNAGPGFSSYLWNTGSITQVILANLNGDYWVTVTNGYGCSNSDTVHVIVNAVPVINLGSDTSTCNLPVLLDAGSGFNSYQWSNGATTQTITANNSSYYTVTVTNNYGCAKSDVIHVSINPLPVVNLGNDTSTCDKPIVLHSGINNATYLWSNGKSTKNITVNASGDYSVIVTDTNGCSGADSIHVTINPVPPVNLGNDTATCNTPVTLDAYTPNVTYQWNTGDTSKIITVNASMVYAVVVTDSIGCSNTDSVNVVINSLPIPLITQNLNVLTSSYLSGNQWYMNGSIINGAINNSYSVILDGWYYVIVTDSNGCIGTSDSVYIQVSSVNENYDKNGIALIPNPADNEVKVVFQKNTLVSSITVTDMLGKEIIKQQPNAIIKSAMLNIKKLIAGVYFVNVKVAAKQSSLILQKR